MYRPLGLTVAKDLLYALRADGTVFVLMTRGSRLADGRIVQDPFWAICPAIPGTEGAVDQEGQAGGGGAGGQRA